MWGISSGSKYSWANDDILSKVRELLFVETLVTVTTELVSDGSTKDLNSRYKGFQSRYRSSPGLR